MTTAHKAWLFLLVVLAAALVHKQWSWRPGSGAQEDGADGAEFRTTARIVLGLRELEKIAGQDGQAVRFLEEMESKGAGERDYRRLAVLEAEIRGAERAREVLEDAPAPPETRGAGDADQDAERDAYFRELLVRRYEGGELDEEEQARLEVELGWFAELSEVYGRDDDDPERRALLDGARTAAIVAFTFLGSAIPAILVGFVLLVLFLVSVARGRTTMRFALHDEGSGDLVWLQSVVLSLALFLLLVHRGFDAVGVPGPLQPWLALFPLLWPLARGTSVREWAGGIGLRGGRAPWREVGAGVVGYLAGLPIIVFGFWLTSRLSRVTGLEPDHPMRHQLAGDAPVWMLLLSGVVWAPLVEELLFRGAFYRYLRPSVSVVGASLISGLLFAALHPQGLAGIPVILSIAIVFAGLREWRGSIYASMTAHAVHNGLLILAALAIVG